MYKKLFKRVIDLIFSVMSLPILVLLFLFLSPLIYFEDKGTILYKSARLGKEGKLFTMYKFRTMKMYAPDLRNAEGSTFNSEKDERMTKIGKILRKISFDEIPQLVNVLKGDMSIIGPRPDLPEALNIYTLSQKEKLKVRPGITGYNQAYFRNSASFNEKMKNDVFYVNNLSFILDMKILLKSINTVIFKKNIYNSRKDKSND
ncbi:MAG: sugar transferase [Firmicutes bacterium]|nr:sugar transferase [Bacillota bacterium]